MPRPRRLYKEKDKGKYYYIINGKKKYVKVPDGVSSKDLARINIQNIIKLPSSQRIKNQRGLRQPKFGKKIASSLQKDEKSGLPLYVFKPKKKIKTLEDLAKESDDTSVEKLSKLLLKGIEAIPSSSKIPPTISSITDTPAKLVFIESEKEQEKPKKSRGRTKGSTQIRESGRSIAQRIFKKKKGQPITETDVINEAKTAVKSTGQQMPEPDEKTIKDAIDTYSKMVKANEDLKAMPPPPPRKPKLQITDTEATTVTEIEDPMYRKGERQTAMMKGETETDIEGFGYNGDGLYNDEIEKIAKKRIKDYVPVIASDQLNELPKYVGRGDTRFGFVINTNPSTSDGSGEDGMRPGHWMAVFINNEDDYPSIEFFDPLAEGKMPDDLIRMCRRIAIKMNPEMMFKYKQNMLRRQSKLTSNCGWHAVKFLDDRYNGVPFSEATGYDDYMENLSNVPDGSKDGEKEIASYIKKYESYI